LTALHYRSNVPAMSIAQSKVTAQGQISVPAEIRKKLGLRPGSVLEWDERGGEVVIRRAVRYTSSQVHEALFGAAQTPKVKVDVKEGIRKHIRRRHARD
jgi:antitoxin PrlF